MSAISAKAGDAEARERLIATNQGWVSKLAFSFSRHPGWSFDDAFVVGLAGLNHAIDKFDPFCGVAFTTYATYWIKQRIQRELQNTAGAFRVPVHVWAQGRDGVAASLSGTSIDSDGPKSVGLRAWLSDLSEHRPDRRFERASSAAFAKARIGYALECLSDRDASIIGDRWLADERPTLEVVSQKWAITRERVRQLEVRALGTMARVLGSPLSGSEVLDNLWEAA